MVHHLQHVVLLHLRHVHLVEGHLLLHLLRHLHLHLRHHVAGAGHLHLKRHQRQHGRRQREAGAEEMEGKLSGALSLDSLLLITASRLLRPTLNLEKH